MPAQWPLELLPLEADSDGLIPGVGGVFEIDFDIPTDDWIFRSIYVKATDAAGDPLPGNFDIIFHQDPDRECRRYEHIGVTDAEFSGPLQKFGIPVHLPYGHLYVRITNQAADPSSFHVEILLEERR